MISIAQLDENEFKQLSKWYVSSYPLLFWKLEKAKNKKDFHFKYPDIKNFYEYWKNNKSSPPDVVFGVFNTFLFNNYKKNINKHKLLDTAKTFWTFYEATKHILHDIEINNSHDGCFNNYYGPLYDVDTKIKLEKVFKNKTLIKRYKKYFAALYAKKVLNYTYRLLELNGRKEAVKFIKKHKFRVMDFIRSYIIQFKYKVNLLNGLLKYLIAFIASYREYLKYSLNRHMFLYRNGYKKHLRKVIRENKYNKLFLLSLFDEILLENRINIYDVKLQHILKLIEASADYYIWKRKPKTLKKIFYLFYEFAEMFIQGKQNVSTEVKYYNVIIEFYLTIFYVLEKVYQIDIMNLREQQSCYA